MATESLALRPWKRRASSFPALPGPVDECLANLRFALDAISNGLDRDDFITWPSGGEPTQVGRFVTAFRATGLVETNRPGTVAISDAAEEWLTSADVTTLARTLHEGIRFVGEMLSEVADGRRSPEQLRVAASDRWSFSWKTQDQIHRRTKFFYAAGFLEHTFDQPLALTDRGREFLDELQLQDPSTIKATVHGIGPIVLPTLHSVISDEVASLTQDSLAGRKKSLGYIPSSGKEPIGTISFLVDLLTPRCPRREIEQRLGEQFGLGGASPASVIQMLKNTGLAEQVSLEDFAPTPIASAWLEGGDPVELIYVLHTRLKFVGELLAEVESTDRVPALTEVAKQKYGFATNSSSDIRTRIHLLVAAGLVSETGWGRYGITPLGRAMVDSVPLEDPQPETEELVPEESSSRGEAQALAEALVESARDSDHPDRLEQAVADSFRFLGFAAEWVGGSGKTDVIVRAIVGPQQSTTAIIDAKSAGSGGVSENRVHFDTLEEHRVAHGAQHVAVVGERFNGRLDARARRQGVALLTIERLSEALLLQEKAPLSPAELLPLLTASKTAEAEIRAARSTRRRLAELVTGVLGQLEQEASQEDEVTKGAVTVETLYLLLRSSDIEPRPTLNELASTLDLLASPFVGVVAKRDRQYTLAASPLVAVRRLEALATAAAAVSTAS